MQSPSCLICAATFIFLIQQQTVDVKGFQDIRISRMVQTSLTATVEAKEISPGDVNVPDMELRVYKINFS